MSNMPTVIITAESLYHSHGPHVPLLQQAGFDIVYPVGLPISTEDQTIDALCGVVAVIAGSEPYSERVLAALPELRIISRCGVGCDCIDLEATARRRVPVTITPSGNCDAVAEHALALILALARSIVRNDRDARQGRWLKIPLVPLRGRTIGLVGLGRIGRSMARRAAAFRLTVLGCDPNVSPDLAREYGVELADLNSLLGRSDFVSLHLPVTPETRGLFDRSRLAAMKPGAFLVNTSRGGLIVEADLVEALQTGHLAGAGLDVLVDEPPRVDNPLLALENVLVSPHVAANDHQAIVDMALGAAQNIIDFFRGMIAPACLVTPGWSADRPDKT
jgi:D-3-phosphoglycerate dehydrogenase/(S)-sulfolactate dehydrogenase